MSNAERRLKNEEVENLASQVVYGTCYLVQLINITLYPIPPFLNKLGLMPACFLKKFVK
jgi:hypothetical protein